MRVWLNENVQTHSTVARHHFEQWEISSDTSTATNFCNCTISPIICKWLSRRDHHRHQIEITKVIQGSSLTIFESLLRITRPSQICFSEGFRGQNCHFTSWSAVQEARVILRHFTLLFVSAGRVPGGTCNKKLCSAFSRRSTRSEPRNSAISHISSRYLSRRRALAPQLQTALAMTKGHSSTSNNSHNDGMPQINTTSLSQLHRLADRIQSTLTPS
jgi:hypothetical protein